LFCNFSGKSDEVQHLMEKAFGSSYTGFSANFDINREVHFSGQSRTLNIDDSYRIDLLLMLQIIHNAYQILSFT